MVRKRFVNFLFFIAFPLSLWGCTGDKPEVIENKCSTCHSTSLVYKNKRTAEEWDRILFGMKTRGLKVAPGEEREIRDILGKNYSVK